MYFLNKKWYLRYSDIKRVSFPDVGLFPFSPNVSKMASCFVCKWCFVGVYVVAFGRHPEKQVRFWREFVFRFAQRVRFSFHYSDTWLITADKKNKSTVRGQMWPRRVPLLAAYSIRTLKVYIYIYISLYIKEEGKEGEWSVAHWYV